MNTARVRERRGLPIAAHLALMLALAFAAAFVVTVATIIWLPPRPPQVVRGDQVLERYVAGYQHARLTGRLPANDVMEWRLVNDEPHGAPHGPEGLPAHLLGIQLSRRLDLDVSAVRIQARAAQAEFVYRVGAVERQRVELNAVEITRNGDRVEVRRVPRAQAAPNAVAAPRERGERRRITPRSVTTTVSPDGVTTTTIELPERSYSFSTTMPVARTPEPDARAPAAPTPPAQTAPTPPAPPAPPAPVLFAPPPQGVVLLQGFEIGARMPDGRWLVMQRGRDWESLGWIGRAALVVGATLLVLTLLALLFARRLAKPIQGFADAVQAVGVNPQSASVEERGPRELRSAARAVNTMQARLRSLIADRTKTLATVAHDMRTPLMRLRLTAENADPALRDKMGKQIDEVEALVASFIAFARDDPAEEPRVRLDLAALLQSLADDAAAMGKNVSYEGEERLIITGQSLGLKRLFSNLIDNAVKYGAAARVRVAQEEGKAIVDVADDGPGVPPEERESVFKPFVRLTAAAGGAGLGLPAARGIARAHGGEIVFLDSARGAHVRTTLPL